MSSQFVNVKWALHVLNWWSIEKRGQSLIFRHFLFYIFTHVYVNILSRRSRLTVQSYCQINTQDKNLIKISWNFLVISWNELHGRYTTVPLIIFLKNNAEDIFSFLSQELFFLPLVHTFAQLGILNFQTEKKIRIFLSILLN